MLSPYNVLTRWQGWGNSRLFHMGPNLIPVDSTLMTYSTSQRSHLRVPSLLGVWISTYEFWVDTNLLPKHSTPPCNFNITDVLHMNLCTACTFVLQTQRRGWYLWSLSLRTVFYPLESLESRPGASETRAHLTEVKRCMVGNIMGMDPWRREKGKVSRSSSNFRNWVQSSDLELTEKYQSEEIPSLITKCSFSMKR